MSPARISRPPSARTSNSRRRCRARPMRARTSAPSSSATNLPIIISAPPARIARTADCRFQRRRRMKNWKAGAAAQPVDHRRPAACGFRSSAPANIRAWSATSNARRSSRNAAAPASGSAPRAGLYLVTAQRRLSSSSTIRSAASSALSFVVSMRISASSGASYGLSMPVKFLSSPARALA